MQDDASGVADFLVHQKGLDVCSLVSRKLNDFPYFLVLLNGTVATEILLECLANSLNVEIVGQAGDGRDTLAPVSLLDTDVNLFFGVSPGVVSGVLKGVCELEETTNRLENNSYCSNKFDEFTLISLFLLAECRKTKGNHNALQINLQWGHQHL